MHLCGKDDVRVESKQITPYIRSSALSCIAWLQVSHPYNLRASALLRKLFEEGLQGNLAAALTATAKAPVHALTNGVHVAVSSIASIAALPFVSGELAPWIPVVRGGCVPMCSFSCAVMHVTVCCGCASTMRCALAAAVGLC